MRDYTFTFQVEENRKSSQPWLETNRAFFFSHKYKSGHRQHWRGGAGSVGAGGSLVSWPQTHWRRGDGSVGARGSVVSAFTRRLLQLQASHLQCQERERGEDISAKAGGLTEVITQIPSRLLQCNHLTLTSWEEQSDLRLERDDQSSGHRQKKPQ